jgi:hypothetical protein
MSSNSTSSLSDRAATMTSRNVEGEPMAPPRFAAHSPFYEVLAGDVAASLPAPLARRMQESESIADLNDWLAAGAMYRWISNDAYLRKILLDEVTRDPKQAGMALAKAVAMRMEPPPREDRWEQCDRTGLLLQLAVAWAFFLCRNVLFYVLGGLGDRSPVHFGLNELFSGIPGLFLLQQGT